MSFKPEVQTRNEPGKWYGNALRFATREEAEANARDLMSRWLLVIDCRAVESPDPVNYRWIPGQGLADPGAAIEATRDTPMRSLADHVTTSK